MSFSQGSHALSCRPKAIDIQLCEFCEDVLAGCCSPPEECPLADERSCLTLALRIQQTLTAAAVDVDCFLFRTLLMGNPVVVHQKFRTGLLSSGPLGSFEKIVLY